MQIIILNKLKHKIINLTSKIIFKKYNFMEVDSVELRNAIELLKIDQGNEWMEFLKKIQNEFVHSNIPTSRFLEYSSIQGPMHPNQQYLANLYIVELIELFAKKNNDERQKLIDLLNDDQFGSPNTFYRYPKSSTLNVQHVYHYERLRDSFEFNIEALDNIFEFGGGYGNFARLLFASGFKGEYTIFDFELMGYIQKYYLSNTKHTRNIIHKIKCESQIESLRNYFQGRSLGRNLFIATWSLSESPVDLRKKFEPFIQSFDYIFITFQNSFDKINNKIYFEEFKNIFTNHCVEIKPCRIFSQNFYFTAKKLF